MNWTPFPTTNSLAKSRPDQLQRNYSEIFDPTEYECKTDTELESYARNLRNYVLSLLQQTPFPAFLFDKLSKRLDGVTSLLEKRSAAKGVLTKEQALERMKEIEKRLDATSADTQEPSLPDTPPPKRRRTEAPCQDDIKRGLEEQRKRRQQREEEEEEEETQ